MSQLPALLKKLETLHRQRVEAEHQIAQVEREIIAAGKPQPKPRAKHATGPDTIETIKPLLKALHDAGQPLKRAQLAARLGIVPWAVAYRLKRAIAAKFVEKVPGGRYRASGVVPAL